MVVWVEGESGWEVWVVKDDHLRQLAAEMIASWAVLLCGEPGGVMGIEIPQQEVLRE